MPVTADGATVSVVIPAYNAERYVARAITSCLEQTCPPLEIFVVDDGSSDNTAAMADRFGAPVRVIRKSNGGPASARNRGAAEASGDWIALLDADDWWFPAKLERQIPFTAAPGVGLVHSLADHRSELPPSVLSLDDMWSRNWIATSSVLMRRAAFEALGGFDEARALISAEDYNLWLRFAASEWAVVCCPEVLMHYTRGIGISADPDRFITAALYNVDALEARLGLDARRARNKRAGYLAQCGLSALYGRRMDLARRLLWRSFKTRPSIEAALHLAAATLPRAVLDAKRRAVRQLRRTIGDADDAEREPL